VADAIGFVGSTSPQDHLLPLVGALARLRERAHDEGADLVVGSRFAAPEPGSEYDVGRLRGGAMGVLRLAVRLLSGRTFSDTSSGFRAFSAPLLDFYAAEYPNEYLGDTVEALLLAGEAGLRGAEVDVRMRLRQGGRASASSLRSLYHLSRLLLGIAVRGFVRRPAIAAEEA
jgi:hypothetical protein